MMLRKRGAYGQIGKLGFWSNSLWLAELASRAFLVNGQPTNHFYFPIDTQAFRLFSREQARDILGLPQGASLVLAGADSLDNPRKGADSLVSTLRQSASRGIAFECVCLGNGGQVFAEQAGIPVHRMGYLSDPLSLSLVYSAVDVTATPSRQEAFGQVCQESMICGTPVVAFDTGGHREQIRHRETGYLARCFEAADMADGLAWALEARGDEALRGRIRESACQQAAPDKFLKQFEKLLEQMP
jgi:glycosyltransferase involved in cell wall biosynthesis